MTPESFDESTEAGISRRRMLKRVGAGMAIAWTAPVLTSIRTPAFAATVACSDTGCPGGDFGPCTGNPAGCPDGLCYVSPCFQHEDTEGNCRCVQNAFVSCLADCTNSSQCAPGQFCFPLPGGVAKCADCCGVNCHGVSKRGTGRTLIR